MKLSAEHRNSREVEIGKKKQTLDTDESGRPCENSSKSLAENYVRNC